jgi:hypothetical protein
MLNKKDSDFVKEIKEHLDKYVDKRDVLELEFVHQMVNDWVREIDTTIPLKDDNNLLNGSRLLQWIRQYTNISEKNLEGDFLKQLQRFWEEINRA